MTARAWFKQKCVNCAPQRRRSPVGGGPTHVVVGKHGSDRAAWPGNRPGRSLGTRARLWAGGNLAGRHASEARAGLESMDVDAAPSAERGRPRRTMVFT